MVTIDLAPGQHTIKMTLAGYDLLEATINVSSTGSVTCVSVVSGTCYRMYGPSIMISGNTVTGYLKESAINICTWISEKGGWDKLISFDIMTLVRAYTNQEDLGFEVKSADIMGAIAYYSGNATSGNQLTGCNF